MKAFFASKYAYLAFAMQYVAIHPGITTILREQPGNCGSTVVVCNRRNATKTWGQFNKETTGVVFYTAE